MFGLMRVKKCGMTAEEKEFRRQSYCGTCKTIGSLYGQKSRFLLNHDTVFLAEILTALSDENVSEREKSYKSFNCLSLPKNDLPKSLQFAATANLILTEFKLADHISDENKRRYKFAQKSFSEEFKTAQTLLNGWNFPLDEVKELLNSQKSRENESNSLEDFSFPTAQTTAIFFREGIKQIARNELENSAFELGFEFGKLIYLIDAFEDYEKDFRKGSFNAFRAAFDLKEERFSAENKRKLSAILFEIESKITSKIYELPLSESQQKLFVSRLSQNLHRKLKTNLPVLKTAKLCTPKKKITFAEKWLNASEKARNLARNHSWQMPLVFVFIFVFALVAPAQSREAKSARECFDLSFNLMFLGAIFGSVLAFPKKLLMENPEELLTKKGRRKKAAQSAADGGGDDEGGWCDWCDCCCDCEDGCDCCCECDSCDCGSCCDGCDCGDCCSCDC
ncbi:MAG TPA: DUF5685 family protein [Pyrinomonadaceae bacterium]|nr:DUF5685 family protein [Pyrinomonadaceae bacterium]